MKLTFHNGIGGSDKHSQGEWEVVLTDDEVTITGPDKYEKWEGEWDATTQEISVMAHNIHDVPLSRRLVNAAQQFLRGDIKRKTA